MRLLVHEPMNTWSTAMSVMRVPGLQTHVFERALHAGAPLRIRLGGRVGHAAGDRHGVLGAVAPGHHRRERRSHRASTSLSNTASASRGQRLPVGERLLPLLARLRARTGGPST